MPTPPRRRPRRRNLFTERDLTRAMRAIERAGGSFRIEINRHTGNMQLIPDTAPKDNGAAANPWDEVLTDAADEKRPA